MLTYVSLYLHDLIAPANYNVFNQLSYIIAYGIIQY